MRHHTDLPARSPENPVPKPTPFKSEVEGAQWTPLCCSQLEKVQGGFIMFPPAAFFPTDPPLVPDTPDR